MNTAFVYFCSDKDKNVVRIGYSNDAVKRLNAHSGYGLQLLAIVPATKAEENILHEHFKPHLMVDRDKSTYRFDAVFPYVERLLHWKYATPSLDDAQYWSKPDFQLWRPDKIEQPLWDRNQGALFVTEAMAADVRDTYETPAEVVEVCRRALGGVIDTDPCSNAVANETVDAKSFWTEKQNGLARPWFGRVFLNPPYGGHKEPGAMYFTEKLVSELECGNVKEAITVLNLQSMPTLWFPVVWNNANAHAVWKRRIDFIRPRTKTGSKPFAASKNGTIFSYFGPHSNRFLKEFMPYAMVWLGKLAKE